MKVCCEGSEMLFNEKSHGVNVGVECIYSVMGSLRTVPYLETVFLVFTVLVLRLKASVLVLVLLLESWSSWVKTV